MIKLLLNLNENDLKTFIEYEYKKSAKKVYVIFLIVCLIFFVLSIIKKQIFGAIVSGYMSFVFIVILMTYVKNEVKRQFEKKFKHIVYCYNFSEKGIYIDTTRPTIVGHVETMYNYIEKVVYYKNYIFLYINELEVFIVRISNFASKSEFEIVRERLAKAKKVIFNNK